MSLRGVQIFANICKFNIIQTYVTAYTLDLVCVDQRLVEFCYFPRMGDELLKRSKIV